ncbi:hypothetical protein HAX54_003116, partial [Datura stramonium]|nr:hypothetical protein [Datura stramonium]
DLHIHHHLFVRLTELLDMRDRGSNGTSPRYSLHRNSNLPGVAHRGGMKDTNQHMSSRMNLLTLRRRCSLDGAGSDLEKESGNEAISSLARETEPLRGDVIKAKTPELQEVCAGWMNVALGSYFPNLVREFYVNYSATRDNMCKKGAEGIKNAYPHQSKGPWSPG